MPGATGLASHAAQIGFAAASPQSHQNGLEGTGRGMVHKGRIRDVWQSNLHEEFATLRQLVDKYPYVAMVRHEVVG
jgi:CCR4-NOT transcription complex subunit 7/8